MSEEKKIGMYNETTRIKIGEFSICEMTNPIGNTIWIEKADGEGSEFSKKLFNNTLERFFEKHM